MTLKDQRIDYLRKQLDAHGLVCELKKEGDPELCQLIIYHNPEIELVLSKELLETTSWLFTERADQVIETATEARQNKRGGILR